MREAFVKALLEEARLDPNIILITGDLGFGVLDEFASELPNQFINSGISEQSMMGLAGGLASMGKRVFVYSIGNFPTLRCLEQIRNDVCLMQNPVCVVSVGAGYSYGSQGYSHHALEDISCMRALPNLEIAIPGDPVETSVVTKEIAHGRLPTYLRLGKSKEFTYHVDRPQIDADGMIKIKDGKFGSILFVGSIGKLALNAHEELSANGRDVNIYSVPYLNRITKARMLKLAGDGKILTLEEHGRQGGFGSSVLEKMSEFEVYGEVKVLAAKREELSLIGDQDYLRKMNGLSVDEVTAYFN